MNVVKYWECPLPCGVVNELEQRVCEACGTDRPIPFPDLKSPVSQAVKSVPPAYREFPDRKLERAAPDEVCACGKTVRQHIDDFLKAGDRIAERLTETRL